MAKTDTVAQVAHMLQCIQLSMHFFLSIPANPS